MLGKLEEFDQKLEIPKVLTIIGASLDHNTIATFFKEQIDPKVYDRLKLNMLLSVSDLKFFKSSKDKDKDGLINTEWIRNISLHYPSVVIYIKQLQPNEYFSNEMKKWIGDIQSIQCILKKKTAIYFYILHGNSVTLKDQDDRDSIDNLYKILDSKNVFINPTFESIKKSEVKRQVNSILTSVIDYYRQLKAQLKFKKSQKLFPLEKEIKCNIKLGILSSIKNKTLNKKYFKLAYDSLYRIDIAKYQNGTNSPKLNFYEIKTACDWLFFKMLNMKQEIELNTFFYDANAHLNKFNINPYYESVDDECRIFDLFWVYKMNTKIARIAQSSMKSNYLDTKFPGYYYLKATYALIRLLQFASKIMPNDDSFQSIEIGEMSYSIQSIKTYGTYLEKPPIYTYEIITPNTDTTKANTPIITVLNSPQQPFNTQIHLLYFIGSNKINKTQLNTIIRNDLFANIMNEFDCIKNKGFNHISFYLNTIDLSIAFTENLYDIACKLNDTIISSNNMFKFPTVYYHYIETINQKLLASKTLVFDNKMRLFNNIIRLANHRVLTIEEEQLFFNIIEDKEVIEGRHKKNPILLIPNDSHSDMINYIMQLDYSITGNQVKKNTFELVEFVFDLNSCIELKPIKFKSIKFFFGYENRVKVFDSFKNDLTKDTPIQLIHRIILKPADQVVMLQKVIFEIEGFPVLFEYIAISDKKKTVLVSQRQNNPIDYKFRKNAVVGVNENYHFQCDMIKDKELTVDIGAMNIVFERSNPEVASKFYADRKHKKNQDTETSIGLKRNVLTEYLVKEKDGSITTKQERVSFQIESYESFDKKLSFVIRFKNKGNYTIGFTSTTYAIKQGLTDDQVEILDSYRIAFNIIEPFDVNYKIYSNLSAKMDKKTNISYMLNFNIQVNMLFKNNLSTDVIIRKITQETAKSTMIATNELNDILVLPDKALADSLMTIKRNSNFVVPFNAEFRNVFWGSFGSVKVDWITQNLGAFALGSDIINTSLFLFPEIEIKEFNFSFSYEVPNRVSFGQFFDLVFMIENKTNEEKTVKIRLNESNYFASNGMCMIKALFLPEEIREFRVTLIPLTYGKVMLPQLELNEFNNLVFDKKVSQISYNPDYIEVDYQFRNNENNNN